MALRPYRTTRGCNILPMVGSSADLHLAMLGIRGPDQQPVSMRDGFFVKRHADAEIKQMAALGINSVRFWGSFMSWFMDPKEYLENLSYYCSQLNRYGIDMQFILFNQVPAGSASGGNGSAGLIAAGGNDREALRTVLWTLDNAWQLSSPTKPVGARQLSHWPEPRDLNEWDAHGAFLPGSDTIDAFCLKYAQDMARFFSTGIGKTVYHSMDLYNEVNVAAANPTRWANVRDMVKQIEQAVRVIQPEARLGCGMAGVPGLRTQELVQAGVKVDFLSVHVYDGANPGPYFDAGIAEAKFCGIPPENIMVTECYIIPTDHERMGNYTSALVSRSIGGYLWSMLRNNVYVNTGVNNGPIDGLMRCSQPALTIRTIDDLTFEPTEQKDLETSQTWFRTVYT